MGEMMFRHQMEHYIGSGIPGVEVISQYPLVDDRGYLTVLLEGFHNKIGRVYVTSVEKGVIKAWHMHKDQLDRLSLVSGKAKFGFWDNRENKTRGNVSFLVVNTMNPCLIIIPPGVCHGFMGLGENTLIVNAPDNKYFKSDEYRFNLNSAPGSEMSWKIRDR